MTLIEVMVTALVLVVGVLAVFGVVVSARDLTSKAETLEAASHVAQQEIEAMQSLTFAAMGHATVPGSGPAPHLVAGSPPAFQHRSGSWEPVALSPSGQVAGGPTAWTDGRLAGQVRRYVSWVDDSCCAGTNDYKRLTVVVTITSPRGIATPVVTSTFAVKKEGV